MCIRDRRYIRTLLEVDNYKVETASTGEEALELSLIHISEPTRLGMISYAVFCLKKKRRPPRSTQSRSSAASDVYKRQALHPNPARSGQLQSRDRQHWRRSVGAVSYTHLRAHETRHDLVCRLLLEKKTATTEIYTE